MPIPIKFQKKFEDPIKMNRKVVSRVRPQLVKLHKKDQIDVIDINFCLLGMVTKSLEASLGKDEARERIELCLENVWGKKNAS